MRLIFSLCAAILLMTTSHIHAQTGMPPSAGTPKGYHSFTLVGQPIPQTLTIAGVVVSPLCPDMLKISYSVSYPQGTGSALGDLITHNFAKLLEGEFLGKTVNSTLSDTFGCDSGLEGDMAVTFNVTSPSTGYNSIFFSESGYLGGAHGFVSYYALNFLPGGFLMTLTDLFPDPDRSLPLFWNEVYKMTCATDHDTMPWFFGGAPCGASGPPPADEFVRKAYSDINSLGRLTFSPEGATINLDPYEGWAWADGDQRFLIPKATLIAIGASPAIWGN